MDAYFKFDIERLASVLKLEGIDKEKIEENKAYLDVYQENPIYPPLILSIAYNAKNKYSEEICLNASNYLKNFINSNWENEPKENNKKDIIIINDKNKKEIKEKIFIGVIYWIEKNNYNIYKNFIQIAKYLVEYEYNKKCHEYIKEYINKINNFLNNRNLQKIYAGIALFNKITNFYEFVNEENQKYFNGELIKAYNSLLSLLFECKDINDSTQAKFSYKIIKIFLKSFQNGAHEINFIGQIFDKLLNYIINYINVPLSLNNINDAIFIKLKRICYQIIITTTIQISINLNKTSFEITIIKNYLYKFFELFKNIFIQYFNNKLYIDDYGKTYIYIFFIHLMKDQNYSKLILKMFIDDNKNILLNTIIQDCYLSNNDLQLWNDFPYNYLKGKYNEINLSLNKRYNSCKFFSFLFSYKEKEGSKPSLYQALYEFLIKSVINDNNNLDNEKNKLLKNEKPYYLIYDKINFCLKKECVLYLLKNNKDLILEYSKKDFEILIEKIILPEFESPCAFLREQACNFIKTFKDYIYTNNNLVEKIISALCLLIQKDLNLPVIFESLTALSSILYQDKVKELLKDYIKILLQMYYKLIEETELEQGIDGLQEVIINYKNECELYILELSHKMYNYFRRIQPAFSNRDDGNENFSFRVKIVNFFIFCLQLYADNEKINEKYSSFINIDIVIEKCLLNKFQTLDGVYLLKTILFNIKEVPRELWLIFTYLINSVILEEEMLEYEGELITDITKIICYYILKNDMSLYDLFYERYLLLIIQYVRHIFKRCDKNNEYSELICAFYICNILFDKYRNKAEFIVEEIFNIIIPKIKDNKNVDMLNYLFFLLSTCFYYYPVRSLKYLKKSNNIVKIITLWINHIDKVKKFSQLKFNLFGICSLISLEKNQQEKMVTNYIKYFVEKILILIEKIYEKIQKEKNKIKDEEGDLDEEEYENELFKDFLEGKDISDDESNENEEYEIDIEIKEEIFTEVDKKNPILFIKNSFDLIIKNNPELYKDILNILGNKYKRLNEIFDKEEKNEK